MMYIVRDHDRENFEAKKRLLMNGVAFLNNKHGEDVVELTFGRFLL